MVATGRLISDGLRPGVDFTPPFTRIRRVFRADQGGSQASTQPPVWTVIDFETDDPEGAAEALATALDPDGGWYADLRDGDDRIIVFAGIIFRYAPDDEETRAAAVNHGRSVGVPEHQLDWDAPDGPS